MRAFARIALFLLLLVSPANAFAQNSLGARLATTAALPANTYNNGAGTLTANANGALTVDGVAVLLNNIIIVQNEASPQHNGLYTQTQLGTAGAPYILTRTAPMNVAGSMNGNYVPVSAGAIYAGNAFTSTCLATCTLGVSNITWAQGVTVPALQSTYGRTAASGVGTSIAANTTATLATVTRNSGERCEVIAFGTDAVAGIQIAPGGSLVGADGVVVFSQETAVANQVSAMAHNFNLTTARAIDWTLTCAAP